MELKRGIVVSVKGRSAHLITSSGKIALVKVYASPPNIGDLYESKEIKPSIFSKIYLNLKYISLACALIFMLTISIGGILYFTPVTVVSINEYSSILLKSNRFNKVISVTANNPEAKKLLDSAKVIGKDLPEALENLYSTSVNLGILDEDFITYRRIYSVKISSENKYLNLERYIELLKNSPYIIQISQDGHDLLNTLTL